jgi:ribonuclease III
MSLTSISENYLKTNAWQEFWKNFPDEQSCINKTLDKVGYHFNNINLLSEALCHRSASVVFPHINVDYNERIEFLGDAVLELAVSSILYKNYPNFAEGHLSKLRSYLVKEPSLAKLAKEIELNNCLCLGLSEKNNGGKDRDSTLANALEALIGAIFLDSNYETAKKVINNLYKTFLNEVSNNDLTDHKSKFQEKIQDKLKVTPNYQTLDSSGPDHKKSYEVGVFINEEKIASAWGDNKKKASQKAAQAALIKIQQGLKIS